MNRRNGAALITCSRCAACAIDLTGNRSAGMPCNGQRVGCNLRPDIRNGIIAEGFGRWITVISAPTDDIKLSVDDYTWRAIPPLRHGRNKTPGIA